MFGYTYSTKLFARWWNSLAKHNGKDKLRTRKEVEEFVNRAYNEAGGPTEDLRAMYKRYQAAKAKGHLTTTDG